MNSIYRINIDRMMEPSKKKVATYQDINKALSEFVELSQNSENGDLIVENLFLLDLIKKKNGSGGESITVSETLYVDENGGLHRGTKATGKFIIPEYSKKQITVSLEHIRLE